MLLSMAGLAVKKTAIFERPLGVLIPLAVLEVVFVGLIWLLEYRRETKAVRALRTTVAEEYRDDIDEETDD